MAVLYFPKRTCILSDCQVQMRGSGAVVRNGSGITGGGNPVVAVYVNTKNLVLDHGFRGTHRRYT